MFIDGERLLRLSHPRQVKNKMKEERDIFSEPPATNYDLMHIGG